MKKDQFTKLLKVAKSSTLPILDKTGYVKDGRITSTDLEITMSMPCPWEGEGVVDLKLLSKMKGLTSLVINKELGNAIAKVGHGTQKVALAGDIEEWPNLQEAPEMLGVLNAHDIKNLKIAKRFVDDDEFRPLMTGVYLTDKKIAATNAHWLFSQDVSSELPEGTEIIIPARVMDLLNDNTIYTMKKGKRNNDEQVCYTLTNGDETITFWAILGRYPNFEVVIPQNNPLTLAVDTKTFKEALEAALPSADHQTQQITVFIRDRWMKLHAEDVDFANEFSTIIPVSTSWKFPEPKPVEEGADVSPAPEAPEVFAYAFNGKSMLEILKLSGSATMIQMSTPNRAMLIGPCLLMPLQMDSDGVGFPESEIPTVEQQPVVPIPAVPADGFKPLSFKGIVLADYSDRAFVIRGKTKDHKDKLKELRGRFNPYLEGGPGWIFPKSWFENVVSTLKG
jgi:DNA polymerase III sliding clamp (beta) subunit (PCNA family)